MNAGLKRSQIDECVERCMHGVDRLVDRELPDLDDDELKQILGELEKHLWLDIPEYFARLAEEQMLSDPSSDQWTLADQRAALEDWMRASFEQEEDDYVERFRTEFVPEFLDRIKAKV